MALQLNLISTDKHKDILSSVSNICSEIQDMPIAEQVDLLNQVRFLLHQSSPSKTSAYKRYTDLMQKRRKDWNIFSEIRE